MAVTGDTGQPVGQADEDSEADTDDTKEPLCRAYGIFSIFKNS